MRTVSLDLHGEFPNGCNDPYVCIGAGINRVFRRKEEDLTDYYAAEMDLVQALLVRARAKFDAEYKRIEDETKANHGEEWREHFFELIRSL